MTQRPHDALFKAGFEAPAHAASLFRVLLPASVSAAVDWDSVARVSGSFVDPDLGDRHTDLLFQARMGSLPVLLYLLLEHQSTADPDMPLRVLIYMTRVWERHRKEHARGPLPLILPAVISHAPGGWRAPTSLEAMFGIDLGSNPELERLVPRFSFILRDLSQLDNDTLLKWAIHSFPKVILWVLRDGRDVSVLTDNLEHWHHLLRALLSTPNGVEAMAQIFRYLSLITEEVKYEEIRGKVLERLPETEGSMRTYGEALIQKGHEQGHQQGHQQGQQQALHDTLVTQLALKFGPLPPERLTEIDAAQAPRLAHLLERVILASTLEAVFVEPLQPE